MRLPIPPSLPRAVTAISTLVLAAALLAGCGDPPGSASPASDPVQTYAQTVKLSGNVSDQSGSITAGRVVALDQGGSEIASTSIDGGRYSLPIPAGTALPFVLQYVSDSDKTERKSLRVAVVEPSITNYSINPTTTAIAERAKSLGGYTRKNMMAAAVMHTSVPDEDKTTAGFRGDPTKNYGGWH